MLVIERVMLDSQPEPVSHYSYCVKSCKKTNVIKGL
jgi:hypothetical protein